MPYTAQEKQRAVARLRRIKGQAEALERAVLEGTDCGMLLQQISALRGATNGLMAEVLESHLRETFGAKAAPYPKSAGQSNRKPAASPSAKPSAQRAAQSTAAHREAEIDRLVRLVRSYLK